MTDDIMEETELKRLLAINDPAVLAKIYDFTGQELYGYLAGLTGSTHDAEELLNDLFIRIIDKQETLAKTDNLKAYLFRMAANLAYDRMRWRKKHERCLDDYAVIIAADDSVGVTEEERRKLNLALAVLPPEQRETVVMKFFLKKTFAEIAEHTGISENTVVSRYRYALQKLKVSVESKNER